MSFKFGSKFTFWLQEIDTVKYELYSTSLKDVATIEDSTQFWAIFQFLKRTNDLPNCDMYLFKEGIKPLWQDVNNVGGGCFKIKIEKKKSNKLWESTVFAMLSTHNRQISLINGLRIKIRENFDEIEIWMNSNANEKQKLDSLKAYLKENTQITDERVFNFFQFKK